MQFDPLEFSRFAEEVVKADKSEAALRTATGRLYYAAFLKARQVLYGGAPVSRRQLRKMGGVHAVIIAGIKDRSWLLGTQLDTLREMRVQADYFLLPRPEYQDWLINWSRADAIAKSLIPGLGSL